MRYNNIIENKEYRTLLKELENFEKERKYCKHGLEHLLDVARISYIMSLEDNAGIPKDIIYAAALLHDIGRVKVIHNGCGHDRVSVDIAGKILYECGYSKKEIEKVCDAILAHSCRRNIGEFIETRKKGSALELYEYLQISDQLSRNCFKCGVSDTCKWKKEERNLNIYI